MLESLFGNGSIERVLFYLLVNKRCYGTELKGVFGGSLCVYQQALQRLEGGGILVSFLRGRTRIFEFNPRYPFLGELRLFLERAYKFLPEEVRLRYYEPRVRKRPRRTGKPL